jgi:hypothetical protein
VLPLARTVISPYPTRIFIQSDTIAMAEYFTYIKKKINCFLMEKTKKEEKKGKNWKEKERNTEREKRN